MKPLHIVLLPMTAPGHMIPMLDMAKLFTSRGIKTTIICPLAYADPILKAQESGLHIVHAVVDFPPEGCELPDFMTTPDWFQQFIKALAMLQPHVEKLLMEISPDAIVSDSFMQWSLDSAAKLGIPRLVFYGSGYLSMCCHESLSVYKPYKNSDPFVLPNLPHEFTFLRSQVPDFAIQMDENKDDGDIVLNWMMKMTEADDKSYGAVFNTFYDIDPVYADHWRNILGRKAWDIGPLFLSNDGSSEEKAEHACLAWLDSRTTNDSVVYVCFGSSSSFTAAQLSEIAIGLEASCQVFIWVVGKKDCENEDWLPQGFEERIKSKGMISRGWAPQRSILRHPNVGAFLTHCGWNSVIEGACAGLPMVTWPISAEHFYIEKLVIELMRIGVSVGSKKWTVGASEGVSSEAIATAVKDVMLHEDSADMRIRARSYKELAEKAVKEGGSSYCSLTNLMEELSNYLMEELSN